MISAAERTNAHEEAMRVVQDGVQARIWTLLPGVIESFDATKMTAVVQPAIKAKVTAPDGSLSDLALPLLLDCPVVFPSGGGATLTFPLAKGDECIVHFASRCIDAWWQSGGVQPQAELRMHDLSDGFAHVGVRSQPNVIASVSTSAVELRSDTGTTRITLSPSAQTIAIVAPGGVTINDVTFMPGGVVRTPDDVTAGAVSLKTHVHTGVTTGGGLSGAPKP